MATETNQWCANLARHQVDFADAVDFEWNRALETLDDRSDYREERWVAIGFIGENFTYWFILFVPRISE